ncbi:MAG: repeat protein, partial [Lacunisphaera sp.]|nr:repeat protein [Lacunisphaera sp.]
LPAKLGFALADFNLDGHEEIFSGEGAAELHLNKFEAGRDFARTPVMLGKKNRDWRPLAWDAANTWLTALTARGIAVADFDGDGDQDVVIAQNNGHPLLLRNDQRSGSPWLRLRLIAKHGHPEAGGARVEVHTPRHVFVRTVAPAMGFMAQSESTLTFGLGDDARVRQIVVTWPDGARQEIRPDGINRLMVITQP